MKVNEFFRWIFKLREKREEGWVIERRVLKRRAIDQVTSPAIEVTNVAGNNKMTSERTAKLVDAILEAWTKCLRPPYGSGEFSPDDGSTDCNRFVHEVCVKLGFAGFEGLRANKMFELMDKDDHWLDVSGATAAYYANLGGLIVAAWKNPDPDKSGHVAIVRPGMAGSSAQWDVSTKDIPKIANVGPAQTCRLDRGANFAFGKDSRPTYFFWTVSLKKDI